MDKIKEIFTNNYNFTSLCLFVFMTIVLLKTIDSFDYYSYYSNDFHVLCLVLCTFLYSIWSAIREYKINSNSLMVPIFGLLSVIYCSVFIYILIHEGIGNKLFSIILIITLVIISRKIIFSIYQNKHNIPKIIKKTFKKIISLFILEDNE